jgi:hypothetical protein
MKHPSTRELFDYWNLRRAGRYAPERSDIEPGAIRRVLSDSFILAFDPLADHPFRLAGTRVCALFGRELKGEPFGHIWDEDSRSTLRDILTIVADEAVGIVAGATAHVADHPPADLEMLLLPLAHRGRTHVRMLGVLAPLAPPYWLGTFPVERLALGSLRHLGTTLETVAAPRLVRRPADEPPPRHLAPRRGLVVHDGGRS